MVRPAGLRRPAGRRERRSRPGWAWNWTAIAAVVAAVASAAGVYFTGRSLEATRAQNAVAEQGQLTDRFTKAVDQLDRAGAEHLQARLGAVYALERLARDSPRDHPTVVEVLSAFVRSTAPYRPPIADGGMPGECPDQRPAVDVQAALTVLGRRNADHDQVTRVDLTNTCLGQVNLVKANFARANLVGADVSFADLTGANLAGADVKYAKALNATFVGTNLVGANLGGAHFVGAVLDRADLTDAIVGTVDYIGADFSGVGLTNANLTNAKLYMVDLTSADLRDSNLSGANLAYADLTRAALTDARHDHNTIVTDVVVDETTQGVWWR
ncbi:pentapeptide repeat-containing protein [Saccharothrix hoggarensis]|uniref:Pentapeptide repeat-containing protein n=1 Tax=Saccharothrix hoggarensis TaxID=913853 RepID=A0ABW3R2M9_9PSEU